MNFYEIKYKLKQLLVVLSCNRFKFNFFFQEYIKALCNPIEEQQAHYPKEIKQYLTNHQVHAKLEKTSKTAILFEDETARIQGCDSCAVIVALSAIEDIILEYYNSETETKTTESIPLNSSPNTSQQLMEEYNRVTSLDDSIVIDENYESYPNAVKRSMLGKLQLISYHS